jgi:hypothetical protein
MSPFTKEATSKTRPHYDSLLPATLPDTALPPSFGLEAWGGVSMALQLTDLGVVSFLGPGGPSWNRLSASFPCPPAFLFLAP